MDPSNAVSVSLRGSSDSIRARSPEADADGRTRSHPHPWGGPYQCPKCEGFFRTSPLFAFHMRTHYQLEREDRKRRRVETKSRHRASSRLAGGRSDDGHGSTHESVEAEAEALAGNAHMDAKTKNAEAQEKEVENAQGTGSARGNLETKIKPVM